MASTIYNGRLRLRKMVRGYALAHSVRTATDVFTATIIKTAPVTWEITIKNEAKVIVSVDVARTLALAEVKMIGQLSDLGVKFAVKQPAAVAVAAPLSAPTPVSVSVVMDTPKVGTLTINKPADHTLTVTKSVNVAHGTLVINNSGAYTYTPTTSYTGPDTATIHIVDDETQDAVDVVMNFTVA